MTSTIATDPRIIIAIDGYAGCGKSTLAKDLCATLGYAFIDTGAMYRAVTWHALTEGLPPDPDLAWPSLLAALPLEFRQEEGRFRILFGGRDIEAELRSMEVARQVSAYAALSPVRAWLVRRQQELGRGGGVVLDGRDIGTVVFPDAELKLFVTADLEARTRRRILDLQRQGIEADPAEVRENLLRRDAIDSSRADSPLQAAPDALWMDTSHMTRPGQLAIALAETHAVRLGKFPPVGLPLTTR